MDIMNDIFRGVIGLTILLGLTWLLSSSRKSINWRTVGVGVLLQLVFAVLILKVPFIKMVFEKISQVFVEILNYSSEGATFLFGGLVSDMNTFGYIFAFQVLPTILFFSALTSVLYYLGILQGIIKGFATVMRKAMGLSGPESLAAAGNIFLGQTESPLLVRPYLEKMTRSEIMALMTGGMATIAGGVFAAYIGFLGGDNEASQLLFATHLLSASIMSAPAALVAAKMMVPETDFRNIDQTIEIPRSNVGGNILEAITNGTTEGIKLAVNVGAMILVFIALIAMVNGILSGLIGKIPLGSQTINEMVAAATNGQFEGLKLELIFGLLFSPLAWVVGIPSEDILKVGQLLGEKTVLNEFIAYASLGEMTNPLQEGGTQLGEKATIIATYALCGFANFLSIGIQIGGISAIAPGQRKTLTELGLRAMIAGTIACLMTGTIAGMLL